jgi:acetyl-CoA carboxylase biotin carboxyl carrier protein
MDLEQLKLILSLVREHDLAELELEQDGVRLRVRKDATSPMKAAVTATIPQAAPVTALAPAAAGFAPAVEAGEGEIELAVVKSPIVGTFYRSAEPGSPAFVEIGSTVKKGQVLCIIEAMKLMNEIDSEYDGEVVSIYVENGHPVQYGERLFAIRTK